MTARVLSGVTIACVLLLGVAGWLLSDSLLRPVALIRASILKETPLGSTSDAVREVLKRKGWLVANYVGSTGFLKQESGASNEIVGITSIRGNVGDLAVMNVSAFWGFDIDGRLIDVWVWRTFNAP